MKKLFCKVKYLKGWYEVKEIDLVDNLLIIIRGYFDNGKPSITEIISFKRVRKFKVREVRKC